MAVTHAGCLVAGDISDGVVESLLIALARQKRTGLLEVYARGQVYAMALREGAPFYVRGGAKRWSLGEVAQHLGLRLDGGQRALQRALLQGKRPIGAALLHANLLTEEQLAQALREQHRLRAAAMLRVSNGRYRFWEGAGYLNGLPRQKSLWTVESLVRHAKIAPRPKVDLNQLLQRLESEDPKKALGLTSRATSQQARSAFRRLAFNHHPDRLLHVQDPSEKVMHHKIFQAASLAFARVSSGRS